MLMMKHDETWIATGTGLPCSGEDWPLGCSVSLGMIIKGAEGINSQTDLWIGTPKATVFERSPSDFLQIMNVKKKRTSKKYLFSDKADVV